jgi:hypothetical protein
MFLNWASSTKKLKKISCHKLVADKLVAIFKEILAVYGIEKIKALRLMISEALTTEKMRGGTQLSLHSWGVAIDLDPDRNLLKRNF